VGTLLRQDFKAHRDELIISSKAGHVMWPGPYGDGGSRKYLMASLDQSLQRLGLEYVDIFYSHRFDPETPLEETMGALDQAVRQGKALYVEISKYDREQTEKAAKILSDLGTPLLVNQVPYSMLRREYESDLFPHVEDLDIGIVAFMPLHQGILTANYLNGIPENSRAANPDGTLARDNVTEPDRRDSHQSLWKGARAWHRWPYHGHYGIQP
jgi:L-glyceraldehyde 3-phosphate reductase